MPLTDSIHFKNYISYIGNGRANSEITHNLLQLTSEEDRKRYITEHELTRPSAYIIESILIHRDGVLSESDTQCIIELLRLGALPRIHPNYAKPHRLHALKNILLTYENEIFSATRSVTTNADNVNKARQICLGWIEAWEKEELIYNNLCYVDWDWGKHHVKPEPFIWLPAAYQMEMLLIGKGIFYSLVCHQFTVNQKHSIMINLIKEKMVDALKLFLRAELRMMHNYNKAQPSQNQTSKPYLHFEDTNLTRNLSSLLVNNLLGNNEDLIKLIVRLEGFDPSTLDQEWQQQHQQQLTAQRLFVDSVLKKSNNQPAETLGAAQSRFFGNQDQGAVNSQARRVNKEMVMGLQRGW